MRVQDKNENKFRNNYNQNIQALDDLQINENSEFLYESQHQQHEKYQTFQQEDNCLNEEDNFHQQSTLQIDELQRQLIFLHQENTLNKIYETLNQKLFWSNFVAFKKIKNQTRKSEQDKKNQLKLIIFSHLFKNNSSQQIKFIGFQKLKQIEDKVKIIKQLKTSFFVKYFIESEYTKLSFAFSKLKYVTKSKNQMKVQKERNKNEGKGEQGDLKLIKFEKQSRKFRTKQLFVTLRNFINKRYLKTAFTSMKFYHQTQQYCGFLSKVNENDITKFTSTNVLNQSKDARFIKKKIVPHKIIQETSMKKGYSQQNVLSLGSINLGNYQVQSIKRKDFEFIKLLELIFEKKKFFYYSHAFYYLVRYKLEGNEIDCNSNFKQQRQNQLTDEDADFNIIKNVMKNMCYVTSQANKKRDRQRKTQNKKISIKIIKKTIEKHQLSLKSEGFYSIKLNLLRENAQISNRISELEEIKRQCLQYFNNSLMQSEDIE